MSNPTTQAPSASQLSPEDFPVSWENPTDAKLFWLLEPHCKFPMAPLAYSIVDAFLRGVNPAHDKIGLPFHVRTARINTYVYIGIAPTAAPPEAVMKTIGAVNRVVPGLIKLLIGRMIEGMSKQQLEKLNPILERFDAYWQDELLPEIKQHLAYFESCDLRGLSKEQLRAHFAESLKRVERMATLHMLAVTPSGFAMSQFEELYCDLFEGATTLDALRLLQGFDNKILEGDRALWQLSRTALTMPTVHQILAERAVADVIPALEKSDEGKRFLAELRAYLDQYGKRLNSAFALTEPSWIENPTIVIENLRAYITRPDARPEAEQAALAAEREKAIVEARAKLKGYPQKVITQFETLLKAAQTATVVHEEHNFWIDQRMFYYLRQIILEIGWRLMEEGRLENVGDVFYLSIEDYKDKNASELQNKVRERKAEMEHFRLIPPPATLGVALAFDLGDDAGPLLRAIMKVDGAALKVDRAQTNANGNHSQTVKGQPGSSGIVRGTAKVIHSLGEAGKLQKGDVLIAVSTLPPWTPLFATAAAVVTDEGGVLSHCAVVAREYRIPAVVGTGHATSTFHDGQLLEVDGGAGSVRLVIEEIEHEPALVG